MVVAYSYIRFSHPEQAKGDSVRRQSTAAAAYAARRGWTLDTTLTLRDLGVSAFHGDNALIGNLGNFLKAIREGKVPPGSALIVESIDRISRQGIDDGYETVKKILKAGVRIITLSPEREFGPEAVKSLSKGALEIQLILERAAEESEMKSQRVGAAWTEKKHQARKNGTPLTKRLPAWIDFANGKLQLNPAKAATVRTIFQLAREGFGLRAIQTKLNRDRVAPIGRKEHWAASYLEKILHNRAVLGEYLPHKGRGTDRKPDGEPVPGFFPACIKEDEWHAAHAGLAQRRIKPGRPPRNDVNLFSGLLRDSLTGGTFTHTDKGNGRLLVSHHRGVAGISFPFVTFEAAILAALFEIDPKELIGDDRGPKEVAILEGEMAALDSKMGELEAALLEGDVAAVVKALRKLEAQKAELAGKLEAARQAAATPLSAAWTETRNLLEALQAAPDQLEAKTRLRGAMRRIIESIWMVVIPREGQHRLCYVQIFFADGKTRRSYMILHEAGKANAASQTGAQFWVRSAKLPENMRGSLKDKEFAIGFAAFLKLLKLEAIKEFPSERNFRLTGVASPCPAS